MARIAGLWYFDRRAVSPQDEAAAVRALGSAAVGIVKQSGLLMLSSLADGCAASKSGYACVWDGRLDNRREVETAIGAAPDSGRSPAALLLSAVQRSGPEACCVPVGDWSAVIADTAANRLLLASDFAGIRPLYYKVRPDSVLWASSLGSLAAWVGERQLDELFAAQFLAGGGSGTRTPYRGIRAVDAGGFVELTASGRIAKGRFWNIPATRAIRYANESDYARRLLELFSDSVESRVASHGVVSTELSGGLDSSSVTCMARRFVGPRNLITFSYCRENSTDGPFIQCVEQLCGSRAIHIGLTGDYFLSAGCSGQSEPLLWEKRHKEVRCRMGLAGSDVLLTGQFGDLIMGNWRDDSDQVADLLAGGRLREGCREAFAWSRQLQVPIYPLLWRAARAAASSTRPCGYLDSGTSPDTLNGKLRKRWKDTIESPPAWLRDADPGKRKLFLAVHRRLSSRMLQTPEPLRDISYSHAFAHRPLVEFMLGIPSSVVCRPGRPRHLMRQAFRNLLPGAIVSRNSKASYDAPFLESCRPLAAELLRKPSSIILVECTIADRKAVESQLRDLVTGRICSPRTASLLVLEFWLRQANATVRVA